MQKCGSRLAHGDVGRHQRLVLSSLADATLCSPEVSWERPLAQCGGFIPFHAMKHHALSKCTGRQVPLTNSPGGLFCGTPLVHSPMTSMSPCHVFDKHYRGARRPQSILMDSPTVTKDWRPPLPSKCWSNGTPWMQVGSHSLDDC